MEPSLNHIRCFYHVTTRAVIRLHNAHVYNSLGGYRVLDKEVGLCPEEGTGDEKGDRNNYYSFCTIFCPSHYTFDMCSI